MDFQKLKKRVIGILSNPITNGARSRREQDDIASVYTSYIMPMAAIPAICMFLGLGIVGAPFGGRSASGTALSSAIYSYFGGARRTHDRGPRHREARAEVQVERLDVTP